MADLLASAPGLLVSVRSPEEAEAALAGGASLVDIKEPAHGPLGRADDGIIATIVRTVAGRRPVSAALGELLDAALPPGMDLAYVKWGLAGCRYRPDWPDRLAHARSLTSARLIVAAYADWECAVAPSPDEVVAQARALSAHGVLLDTCCKTPDRRGRRPTILDWLPVATIVTLCRTCHAAGLRVALAGSLGRVEITALADARPDWFAVRGAACIGGERDGTIDVGRVAQLVHQVNPAS